jgi:hypothetical protein
VYAGDRGGGCTPTGIREDNREAPLLAGRGGDVDALAEATMLRKAVRQGARWRRRSPEARGGRHGGGGWGGDRRDEYGDQEPRRPGQVREEAACVLRADGGDRQRGGEGGEGVGGSVDSGFREAASGEESRGRGG